MKIVGTRATEALDFSKNALNSSGYCDIVKMTGWARYLYSQTHLMLLINARTKDVRAGGFKLLDGGGRSKIQVSGGRDLAAISKLLLETTGEGESRV